jgi:hypothetical protein
MGIIRNYTFLGINAGTIELKEGRSKKHLKYNVRMKNDRTNTQAEQVRP